MAAEEASKKRPWFVWIALSLCLCAAAMDVLGYEPMAMFFTFFLALGSFCLLYGVAMLGQLLGRTHGVRGRTFLATVCCLGLIWWFRPGLHIAWFVSKDALSKAADNLKRGEKMSTPGWIGAFYIHGAEVRYDQYPAFHLTSNREGPSIIRGDGVNEWSSVRLQDQWQLFTED